MVSLPAEAGRGGLFGGAWRWRSPRQGQGGLPGGGGAKAVPPAEAWRRRSPRRGLWRGSRWASALLGWGGAIGGFPGWGYMASGNARGRLLGAIALPPKLGPKYASLVSPAG